MKQNLMLAHSGLVQLSHSVPYTAMLCDNDHIKHLINSNQGEYWRTLCVCAHTLYLYAYTASHTRTHTHSICTQAHCPLPSISVISAWLAASAYLFLFQIMNFITKSLHAYNHFLQPSAFPKHLAAAQIMFALNAAQCLSIVSAAAEGRRLLLVQMSLSLWALFLSLL